MNVIGMVVNMTLIENKPECKVNEYDATLCEQRDRSSLSRTLSPEISCVIEYAKGVVDEASISGWQKVYLCLTRKHRDAIVYTVMQMKSKARTVYL